MLDDHGFEIYENNAFPQAYLLTIRTFGTWLHGARVSRWVETERIFMVRQLFHQTRLSKSG